MTTAPVTDGRDTDGRDTDGRDTDGRDADGRDVESSTGEGAVEFSGGGRNPSRLPHFPALDGLRGLAVAGVLVFHGGFSWAVGGYLGVSTFFTLSGFLITSLLLLERSGTGRIAVRPFLGRRIRRLLPASLLCMVLVVAFGVLVADPLQRQRLAGDVIASMASVANWRFIVTDQAYVDLFASPSPVLHFWSLAIEEQFYLLFPLLVAGVLSIGLFAGGRVNRRWRYWGAESRHRRRLAFVLLALIGLSLAVTLLADFTHTRIYFGTDTRMAELLIGGLLAVALFDRRAMAALARRGPVRQLIGLVGVVALGSMLVLWWRTPQTSQWLYEGGFGAYALLSAVVVLAALLPTGPVAWLLGLSPLRHLGRISYGVYLYHWPVFLWLRQATDLAPWPRFAIGVAVSLVLAELSFRYVEMPVRRGERLLRAPSARLAPLAVAVIAVSVVAVSRTGPEVADPRATEERLAQVIAGAGEIGGAEGPPPPRVAFFGDSTALMSAWGTKLTLREQRLGIPVDGVTKPGCAVVRTEVSRLGDTPAPAPEGCDEWEHSWAEALDSSEPTVAVVQSGMWDIVDRLLPGDDTWRAPGDPVFDAFLAQELTAAVDTLSADGALVVWFTSPNVGPGEWRATAGFDPDPRMARYNEIVRSLPELRPGRVVVIDLAAWVEARPDGDDSRLRPDGAHFTEETSLEVAEAFLVPAILDAYRAWWSATHPTTEAPEADRDVTPADPPTQGS